MASSPDPWFGGILQTSGCVFPGGGNTVFSRRCLGSRYLHGNRSQPPGRFAARGPEESRTPKEVATTDSLRGNGKTRENALIPERTGPPGTSKGTREKKQQNIELEEIILERVLCIWLCFAFLKSLVEVSDLWQSVSASQSSLNRKCVVSEPLLYRVENFWTSH